MAEFTYNPVQTVNANQPVIFNNSIPCNKGYVYHRNESGVVTLRGIVNNCNACFARYKVTFNANIAVPTGETVGPIAIAVSQSGEPILTSRAVVTPTAVDAYFNVTSPAIIDVPRGCCFDISVENISDSGDPINVQNSILSARQL